MNAICASENFDLFIVLPRPAAQKGHPAKLEFSSKKRSRNREAGQLVRRLVDERPTYGYRRITALANRELARTGEPMVNHKRMFRIMRQNGMLLARHTGRRIGRLHDGNDIRHLYFEP